MDGVSELTGAAELIIIRTDDRNFKDAANHQI
jgi:hypothetical protein